MKNAIENEPTEFCCTPSLFFVYINIFTENGFYFAVFIHLKQICKGTVTLWHHGHEDKALRAIEHLIVL